MAITIELDETNNQFFTMIEGDKALLSFRIVKNGVYDFYHTFVPPRLRNRGIAGELVAYALAYARTHGHKVVPSCPFVRNYVDEHGSLRDVVVD